MILQNQEAGCKKVNSYRYPHTSESCIEIKEENILTD